MGVGVPYSSILLRMWQVLQSYIASPLLINGRKWDARSLLGERTCSGAEGFASLQKPWYRMAPAAIMATLNQLV